MKTRALVPFLVLTFALTWGIAALLVLFTDPITAIFGEIDARNPLYILAVYAFGVALVQAVGRPEPQNVGERALCGGIGALATGIIALVPLLGWLFVLALTLTGLGAVVQRLFRPRFLAPA